MKRKIVGYHKDDRNDWVADLECHHGQHVRHNPPFTNRPWVETPEGREEKLGFELDCVRCDRLEWPDHLKLLNRSEMYNETNIERATREADVNQWALICVVAGKLLFRINDQEQVLTTSQQGIVVPDMSYQLEPIGNVEFYIEFHEP